MIRGRHTFWRSERGASTVEFVLVLPLLLLLTLGFVNLCALLYSATTLHYAAEDAARCRSVKTAICSDATTTQTYATSRYAGPKISAVFTATQPSCGNQVVGTGTYKLITGIRTWTVPLSATACFPS